MISLPEGMRQIVDTLHSEFSATVLAEGIASGGNIALIYSRPRMRQTKLLVAMAIDDCSRSFRPLATLLNLRENLLNFALYVLASLTFEHRSAVVLVVRIPANRVKEDSTFTSAMTCFIRIYSCLSFHFRIKGR